MPLQPDPLPDDALHAIGNASYVESEFDEPPIRSRVQPTLFIGHRARLRRHLGDLWPRRGDRSPR